ncbi:c-type cytochrome [Sphingomonas oligophenolica]
MVAPTMRAAAMIAGGAALVTLGVGVGLSVSKAPVPSRTDAKPFEPPPDTAIPDNEFGKAVKLGREIFTDTRRAVPQFVGNDLSCSNCHLDAGRRPNASPLWAAYGLYPQYRAKNGHVNSFAERLQECFRYSMNGRMPPAGDRTLVALESYATFLARGASIGVMLPGQGFLKLPKAARAPDYERGRAVYAENCAQCHGEDGGGLKVDGKTAIPPLWGGRSFNWGAGMARTPNAAGFIKANMPQDRPGALTSQQAWDVAAYIDGKPRPQDPRYAGSVEATRRQFHEGGQSAYGTTVDGVLLGGDGPPETTGLK